MAPPLTAGALALSLALAACARSRPAGEDRPLQTMERFTMTQTEKSRTVWELSAPRADISLSGEARLDRPVIRFFREGRHASTARALKAFVDGESRDVALEGDVVVEAHAEESVLRTERLEYEAARDRLHTDRKVLIDRPGSRLRGRGLEADSALSSVTIFDQETVLR